MSTRATFLSAVAKYLTEAALGFRRPSAHGKGGMGTTLLISSRVVDSEAKTRLEVTIIFMGPALVYICQLRPTCQ